ncbi:MAG TPA: NAD(P)-dependent oxidoreductase [Gemmatimonadaceae bacterium]|nr:NAD(P)-dependent oxidoreductase [Gemmatimonadaceae bacterium]
MTSNTSTSGRAERLLVVDLASTSRNWALKADGEAQIVAASPPGWGVHFVRAATTSDGDGNPTPSHDALAAIAGADAYFGFGISRALFVAGARLQWVHSATAGMGALLFPEMVASAVRLTNSAGVHGPPIAESVVAGVMHFLRGLDVALDQQRAGTWSKSFFVSGESPLREVADCRVLVIGAGGIGSEVATRFTALGATCVGVRRHPASGVPPGFARVVGPEAIDAELPGADVVVVAAPATAGTQGLLGAERLDRLPAHAIVVNVARGALVDESALAARLAAGRLRGAVLDVFAEEPLAPSSPLWQLRSALLTPHVSAVSPLRFWPRQLALFLDNWNRYVRREPLRNLVDKHAGY